MNCEAVRELLWMYLEKETTAAEAEKIEIHLAECADCREEMEAQKSIMESLASLPDEELPEGYHAELMQKLQAEAAPNVVPFPVKKKKQPMYKQWGMIAAAVLVVVAAGGMNGMLDMRESQNAAVQQMKPIEASMEETTDVTMDMTAEVQEDGAAYKSKKMNAPAAGMEMAAETEETTAAYDPYAGAPETASLDAEDSIQFSITRSAEVSATDTAVLAVSDTAVAMTELQKAIAEVGGFEEAVEAGGILAVIPVENYDGFVRAVEDIGTLTWNEQGETEEGAAYHTVEIQLKLS